MIVKKWMKSSEKKTMSFLHTWERRSQVTYSITSFSYRSYRTVCCSCSCNKRISNSVHKMLENVNFASKIMMCAFDKLHTSAHWLTGWLHTFVRCRCTHSIDWYSSSGKWCAFQSKSQTPNKRTMNIFYQLRNCERTTCCVAYQLSQINWKLTVRVAMYIALFLSTPLCVLIKLVKCAQCTL